MHVCWRMTTQRSSPWGEGKPWLGWAGASIPRWDEAQPCLGLSPAAGMGPWSGGPAGGMPKEGPHHRASGPRRRCWPCPCLTHLPLTPVPIPSAIFRGLFFILAAISSSGGATVCPAGENAPYLCPRAAAPGTAPPRNGGMGCHCGATSCVAALVGNGDTPVTLGRAGGLGGTGGFSAGLFCSLL